MTEASSKTNLDNNQDIADNALQNIVTNLGIRQIERHLFLCADQTKPKCCDQQASLKSWDYLKGRLHELGLDQPKNPDSSVIFRTKANCLRICQDGPILLVYPDGIWYRNATPEVIERIIQEHLLNNQIVKEYVLVEHSLCDR